jgi:AcrR family transcriptional regulator
MTTDPRASDVRRAGEIRLVDAPPVDLVSNGVFFSPPDRLPRGRHQLSREQVTTAQRERLLAATTELLAARGYRGLTPGEIASRAGVSLAAFYENFQNKDEAVFAGYQRFIDVLLRRVTDVDTAGKDRPQLVREILAAYLDTLQDDLVVARAYQVEIDALGTVARHHRRDSLRLFATYIRELVAQRSPNEESPSELPWSAYIGVVYTARQLVSDALDEAPEPDLHTLVDELHTWLSDLFRER